MTRWIVIAVFAAAFGWAGYWWLGARAHQAGWALWLDARVEDGWTANRADLVVRGFPSRFDTTITEFHLADPHRNWLWQAPIVQFLSLSYRPTEVIALWPGTQTVHRGDLALHVTAETLKASFVLAPSHDLPLERMVLEGAKVALVSTDSWQVELARLIATVTREGQAIYDAGIQLEGIRLSPGPVQRVGSNDALPPRVDRVRLRSRMGLSRPLDRPAVEGDTPRLETLEITDFQARWGGLDIAATGKLAFDATGMPSGTLSLRAENWQVALPLLIALDLLPAAMRKTAETGLATLARASGSAQTLDVTLRLDRGEMYLGPIPLGPVPGLWGGTVRP